MSLGLSPQIPTLRIELSYNRSTADRVTTTLSRANVKASTGLEPATYELRTHRAAISATKPQKILPSQKWDLNPRFLDYKSSAVAELGHSGTEEKEIINYAPPSSSKSSSNTSSSKSGSDISSESIS